MEILPVSVKSPLDVRSTLFKSQLPSKTFVLIHHGICHAIEQYERLIEKLNKLGIHAVMVEQRSDDASDKNWIGLSQYRENLATVVPQLADLGCLIAGYVLHSMGAEIGEEMQQ